MQHTLAHSHMAGAAQRTVRSSPASPSATIPSPNRRRPALTQDQQQQHHRVVAHARMFEEDDDDDDGGYSNGVAVAEEERVDPRDEYRREYPNPKFIQETLDSFPDDGVADVEQSRVLFSEDGYTYLDVRPTVECDDVGKIRGCVNIPIVNVTRKYDSQQGKKVSNSKPNDNFVNDVKKRFPKKDAKLLIGCSNGTKYSLDALEALDEAGYTHIVGLKGGYYAWFSVFDNKLNRRRVGGEYAETYTHDGDTCGIHASGAGFTRSDTADRWVPPDY